MKGQKFIITCIERCFFVLFLNPMINHFYFWFFVTEKGIKNEVIFFSNNVFGLKSFEKVKSFIIPFEPTEYSELG